MPDQRSELVARLYESFNHRDEAALAGLCDEEMEFYPAVTAEAIGREAPYRGAAGLREYLADLAQVWDELQVTPSEMEVHGDSLLVHGRVYARSRELGIRDVPVAWVWQVRGGRIVAGEVFPDPELAVARFADPG